MDGDGWTRRVRGGGGSSSCPIGGGKWPRRIREFLLLLIRCACVALVATMFDRPSVPTGSVPSWMAPALPEAREPSRGAGALPLIIVLDTSDSMGQLERGRTRLERAIDAARSLVDEAQSQLRPVAVVVAGYSARPLVSRPTDRYDEVREGLRQIEQTREHADLDHAISVAGRLLASGGGAGAELVVITDGQASGWKQPPIRLPGEIDLRVVLASRVPTEVGVHAVALETDRQRLDSGQTVRAVGLVRHAGRTSTQAVVQWTVSGPDGIVLEDRHSVVVPAGEQSEVGLEIRLDAPGVYAVAMGVEGSKTSNAHALMVVQPEPRIAVISEDGVIRTIALAASDPFETGRAFSVDPLDPEGADELVGADAIIVAGAGLLSEELIDAIANEMLTTGCGLLHFVDSDGAAASGELFASRLASLYPVEPTGGYVVRGADRPGFSSSVPIDDAPAPLPQGSLTEGWFNLEVRRHAPAEVIAGGQAVITLEDDSVLLASSTRQSPVVFAVLTGIDRDSSDLSIAPELPILVDALVRSTRAASGGSDPEVRNAVGDVGDRVRSIGVRAAGPIAGPSKEPGIEVLRNERRGTFMSAFSVNPLEYDARVADLERVVADRTGRRAGRVVVDSDAVVSRAMARVEIWPLLLLGVIGMLAIEMMLLLRRPSAKDGGA